MSLFSFNRAALLGFLAGWGVLASPAGGLAQAPAAPAVAKPGAAPDMTPAEHFNNARAAFNAGDWVQAESLFDSFIKTFSAQPELAETARQCKPMLVTARLRQKKYAETLPLLIETLKDPLIAPAAADELAFWKGICLLQTHEHEAAGTAFGEFYGEKQGYLSRLDDAQRLIHNGRRTEAVLLYGMCLLLKPDPAAAAKFYGEQLPGLRQVNREAAGRATVLRLYALIESEKDDEALALVQETYPRMAEITQVVAFHTLSLQLGSKLLEATRYHDAILCLQRIWPREQLLSTQRAAVASFTARLAQVSKQPGQEYLAFQYEGLLTRIQREIDTFEKIANFDSALRMRLAMAYKELRRYRETALILEDMLARLPADPVVEKATLALIQCWMQVERWPKAVEAADAYLAKFDRKDNPDVPMVHFLKASALHADKRANEAELVFAGVHQLFGDHALAPRALFMEGVCLLEQDLNLEAMDAFREVARRFGKSDVVEDADYWTGMALSFEKRYAEARDHLLAHLKHYGDKARYRGDATFRAAYATFGLAEHERAVPELRAFLKGYAQSEFVSEANLMLGDALGALGKIEEAIATYRAIDPAASRTFYEEAAFRIGKVYQVTERPTEQRAQYEAFLKANPTSPRIAEAVYWIGVTHMQAGEIEQARQSYWDAIQTHGDKPESRGVEDILLALPKVYAGPEGRADLVVKLEELGRTAQERRPTLALRSQWALAALKQKEDPAAARALLAAAAPGLKVKVHSPRVIADIADALRLEGKAAEARVLYTDLRKWHPRALEKDRAYLGLGLLALADQQPEQALTYLERFEKETLGSPLLAEVAGIKGDLFAGKRQFKEAQAEYERVLDMPTAPRLTKARTLLKIATLLADQKQDLKATAYYERVYLSYGKYLPEVAQAYWLRAQALDRLGKSDKAAEVYKELALRPDLAALPEAQRAVNLLNQRSPGWRLAPQENPAAPAPAATKPTTSVPQAGREAQVGRCVPTAPSWQAAGLRSPVTAFNSTPTPRGGLGQAALPGQPLCLV